MTSASGLSYINGLTYKGAKVIIQSMRSLRHLAWILATLFAAACQTVQPAIEPDGPVRAISDPSQLAVPDTTSPVTNSDFRIAPLDLIEVRVFGVPELEGEYQIDQNGQLKMPLIGIVPAKGFSTFELADALESKLGERYLQDPDVTVILKEAFARKVTVEGAVAKPGIYPIEGELSLLQTIAVSGGLTDTANPKRVAIFRTIEGERSAAVFNLEDIRRGKVEDPKVFGNDVIVVDGSDVKTNYREVLRSIPLFALFFVY